MKIIVKETDMKIKDGQLIISINSDIEKLLVNFNQDISSLSAGEIYTGKTGTEYIVCEQFENKLTALCRKEALSKTMKFGDTNNWKNSYFYKYLNGEYLDELSKDFKFDRIVEHETNLLSLDGYDDYEISFNKVSAMNIDQFRKYHRHIGNTKIPTFLSTPHSTQSGVDSSRVLCVDSNGDVYCGDCFWLDRGVRPFFILKS